ncbi:alpha-galactosidase [Stakelama sp. CBK3Z-3]|uniref:Alpha-galactosidase n=1 Tax=Stakelama flava TaxID=2860338 RepID=A0ABS6XKG5_9SPHN|nr:glycoside hydrolase family 36 protein [Stakelama flava]MBW4330670.1 alpha-galactosidase [Stakelama flava]
MPDFAVSRRETIATLLGGTSLVVATAALPRRGFAAVTKAAATLSDGTLTIEFDGSMHSRISHLGNAITAMDASDALHLAGDVVIDRFVLLDQDKKAISDRHGKGVQYRLRGANGDRLERTVIVSFYDRHPGVALIDTQYRNTGKQPMAVAGWRTASHDLLAHPKGAWTYSGASHPDRRDWVQPALPGFDQPNFMGMNGSDYGGGTPVAAVWRPDFGLAVGHVETVPRLISLPVSHQLHGTHIGMQGDHTDMLRPGETLTLPMVFLMAHTGDHFRPLEAYRAIMAERGLSAPRIPDSSYDPIWCAWGYERNFTTEQIYGTLPKAKSVGLEWAVLDDGWQTSEGDWKVDRTKFPRGGADLKAFADTVKAAGMRPRLWYAPLAADPGTDLLRDHPEMLLLDRDGNAQNVTWWDAFTLCPAYPPVVDYFKAQAKRIVGEWGFEGIKFDGQHLNGVAPCYNPAHNHARPEESFEKLQDFWMAMYDAITEINPDAVIEICPCGDAFAFHNIPAMNHTPASDPESSWQVRLKGKTFKALMGPSAPFAGDHVELSDRHDDFASSYGVGGVLSTKFTWPEDTDDPIDTLPPGGFVLTPQKERLWRQWIALYRKNMLSKGDYRGELYDIGFDKPEAHAIAKDGAMHYAFFADKWDGAVELRGLGKGRYRLSDPVSGRALGIATADDNVIRTAFEHSLIVVAEPVSGNAA